MLRWGDWLEQARADESAARDLLATRHWEWCCFACQQAAEKYLKAALESRRSAHEGHSLPALARRLERTGEVPEEVHDACATLNRYYIPTRYPDAHQEGAPVQLYRERDARDALRDLEIVARFVAGIIGPTGD